MLIEKILQEIEYELNWDLFFHRHKQTICWEKAIHFDSPSAPHSQPLWKRSDTELTQIRLLKCSPQNLLQQIESHWKKSKWKRWFNLGIRKKIVLWHYYQQCLAYKEARNIISCLNSNTLSSKNVPVINQIASFVVYRYLSFERETDQLLYYLEKKSFIYSIKIHAFKCDLYIHYCRYLNDLTKHLPQEEQKEIKIIAAKSYQSLQDFFEKFYEQRLIKFPKNNHNTSEDNQSFLPTSTVHTTDPIQNHLIKNNPILTFDVELENEDHLEKKNDFYFLQKSLINVQETLNKYDPFYYLTGNDENDHFNIIIFHLQKIDLLKSYLSHIGALFNQRFCKQISEIQQILAIISDPHSKKNKVRVNNSKKLQLLSKKINQWCAEINQLAKNNECLLSIQTEKKQQIFVLSSFLDKNSQRIDEKREIIPFYKNKMQQTLNFVQQDSLYFLEKLKKRACLSFPVSFFYSFSKKQRKIKKQILFFERFLSQLNKSLDNQIFIEQSMLEQAENIICEVVNDIAIEKRALLTFSRSKNHQELNLQLTISGPLLIDKLKSYKQDKYKYLIQEKQLQKLLFWQDKTNNERLLLYKIEQLKKIVPLKNITEINEIQLAKEIRSLDQQRKKWDKKENKKDICFFENLNEERITEKFFSAHSNLSIKKN